MIENLTIRTATIDDFERVYELNKEFAKLYNAEDKFQITKEQFIKDKDLFKCRVAVIDDIIIGFSTFFIAYYTWVGKAIYLDDLFVTKNYRNKQIGNVLLDDVIEMAKKMSCKKVIWKVSEGNEKAQKFYLYKGAVIDRSEVTCVYNIN